MSSTASSAGRPATANGSAALSPGSAPALIVLGCDDHRKPHAAWFGDDDAGLARKAAGLMGMAALEASTDELRGLVGKLPVGRVFASGRAFVPFVKVTMFDQLASHLPGDFVWPERPVKAAADGEAPGAGAGAGAPGDGSEAGDGPSGEGDGGDSWQKIAVGTVVLAQEKKNEPWFEARVEKVSNEILTLRWRDWDDLPLFARRFEQVGLLHPKRWG